jgi:hypothetical protein
MGRAELRNVKVSQRLARSGSETHLGGVGLNQGKARFGDSHWACCTIWISGKAQDAGDGVRVERSLRGRCQNRHSNGVIRWFHMIR